MSKNIRSSIHPKVFMTEIRKFTRKACCAFQGEQGERGERGTDGATGTPGLSGEPGRDGLRGLKGEKVSRAKTLLIQLISYWHYCIFKLSSYCVGVTLRNHFLFIDFNRLHFLVHNALLQQIMFY